MQKHSPPSTQPSSIPLLSHATPVLGTPVSSPQVTPQSTPSAAAGSIGLPSTPLDTPHTSRHRTYARRAASAASTVDSLNTLDIVTPDKDTPPVIHKRERPHKTPQPPSYDDCPVNASNDKIKRWKQKKNSEKWCYEKLTSADAVEYRVREKE